ncbi:peptide-methionine (S)-S-oxide reductase [Haloarcula sp. CBA1130]|uniref:peptide-methionine (S)-S-oxide reductase MsrA n=1 Tax=unclassified Haloarcula TaxID=2624677 RepID=UPI0012456B33|nr:MULTISPECIES: peptide-methionine (S)-S-oxide reductase MsrA [unclassified Haloarcula]KAA9398200.1 peptide-methionine (S)-S-oxide reductase [Haloarcula sp. CBA1129]KAA9402113.1 peptide-methionine (S)-S-oxide reductase [Haloarcula sp. CBA1130]
MTPSAYEPTHPAELAVDAEAPPPSATATATFGMGCFWGPDARFGAIPGVVRTRVGYAGGTEPDPSYYSLGDHTEVVQVEYDPDAVSYRELLDVVWANHDPFSAPHKRQYRGVVLVHDDRQREVAQRTREDLESRTGTSVETPIEALDRFYLAEEYHQKYELRSTPVVADELEDSYGDAFVDSTVAARLNGFVAGHGDDDEREALFAKLDLSPAALSEVRRRL